MIGIANCSVKPSLAALVQNTFLNLYYVTGHGVLHVITQQFKLLSHDQFHGYCNVASHGKDETVSCLLMCILYIKF
jgi:hypothetical protein